MTASNCFVLTQWQVILKDKSCLSSVGIKNMAIVSSSKIFSFYCFVMKQKVERRKMD